MFQLTSITILLMIIGCGVGTFGAANDPPVPGPPAITHPAAGPICGTTVEVSWSGASHDGYEVHIGSCNYPDSNDGWDSGEVTLGQSATTGYVESGPLQPRTFYYVFVRLRDSHGWGNWSASGRYIYVAGEWVPVNGQQTSDPYYVAAPNGQQWPYDVAYNPDRNEYLVTYTDKHSDGSEWRVSYYILDGTGRRITGEFTITDDDWDGVNVPTVTYNPDAQQYLIVCIGWHQIGTGWQAYNAVRGQLVDAVTGNKVGASFSLVSYTIGWEADVAYSTESGVYLFTWSNETEIRALRLGQNGRAIPSTGADPTTYIINVTANQPMGGYNPSVTYNPDLDEFYVLCQLDAGEQTNGFDYYGQAVTASTGAVRGGSVPIATNAPGWDWNGDIIYVEDLSKYLVVYECNAGTGSIYGQFLTSTGVRDGYAFMVEDRFPSAGGVPSADWDPVRREFLITWQDYVSSGNFGRRVTETGARVGERFRINGSVTNLGNWDPRPFYNPVTQDYLIFWFNAYNDIWARRYRSHSTAVPTGQVTVFTVTPSSGSNYLTWRNPTSSGFTGTMIRYKVAGYPSSPSDGMLLLVKPNTPGASDSYTHNGLTNGTTYYYSAFAYDNAGGYARAANAVAIPWPSVRTTFSSSTFNTSPDGWNIATWRSGPYADGTMIWAPDVGNSGGGMRANGSGATDNTDRCNREGGEIWKTISTAGRKNIRLSYDLRVNSLGSAVAGGGIGTCPVDNDLIDEQLSVFYSTDGGATWNRIDWLKRSDLLGWYQLYRTRQIDLSSIPGANNSPSFALRFRWQLNSQSDAVDLDNILLAGDPMPISSIKSLPDNTPVSLAGKVLYLKQGSFGYIEEPDRSSGIRLEGTITASENQTVSVNGVLKTTTGGERYILVNSTTAASTATVRPLGANNRAIKSSLMDGLYVAAWGRVREGSVTADSFVLTDGSDDLGILVKTPGDPGVTAGQVISVSGAAGYDGRRVIYRK